MKIPLSFSQKIYSVIILGFEINFENSKGLKLTNESFFCLSNFTFAKLAFEDYLKNSKEKNKPCTKYGKIFMVKLNLKNISRKLNGKI